MHKNESSIPKVTVLGIGGAGCKIIKMLSSIPGSQWLNSGVIDTDESSLNDTEINNTFAVATDWNGGAGFGGNPKQANHAFVRDLNKEIEKFIFGSSMLIVTGGLGMGTATGGAPIIGRIAKRLKIPSIFLMTLPFAFEGESKNKIAENGRAVLLPTADIVIALPNDLLFSSINAETSAKLAFQKSDDAISHAIIGLTEVLRCKNMINIGIAELKELLGNKKTHCCLAMGYASDEESSNRSTAALTRFLESPLLNGTKSFQDANVIITTVIGGNDLSIGELKETLESINKLANSEAYTTSGINTDEKYNGKIFITSLLLTYDKQEDISQKKLKSKINKPWASHNKSTPSEKLVQPELFHKNSSKGYFSKTESNIINGIDLDIPPLHRERENN